MNARVLVVHLGSVKFPFSEPGEKLEAYAEAHPGKDLSADPKYQKLLETALKKMRKRMVPYWAQVQESIEQIRVFAAERGVALGFENRERFEELPLDADFEKLIYGVSQPNTVGYWHDCGHAELKQRLGLLKQKEHLEKHAGRLIGFHLHDVDLAGHDHRPIGSGTVDFKTISSFWKPHHLLVLEFSPRLTIEEVKISKRNIEALMKK